MAEVRERCKSTGNFETYIQTANRLRSLDVISDAQLARYLGDLQKEPIPAPTSAKALPGFAGFGETQVLHEKDTETIVRDGKMTCVTHSGTKGTEYFNADKEVKVVMERSRLENELSAIELSQKDTERVEEIVKSMEGGADFGTIQRLISDIPALANVQGLKALL